MKAENGQVVFIDEALNLTDYEGNPLKWKKEDKIGSYSAEGPETDFNTYAYSFQPERQKVTVTVTEIPKSDKDRAKAKAKINKTEAPKEKEEKPRAATISEEKEVKKYQSAATR